MIDQLNHLLSAAEVPNVDLRVVPASAGWTPALEGAFVLIGFDNDDPIVHLEKPSSRPVLPRIG